MNHDRTYWRSQPDKRLIEAVLTDRLTDPELCITLAERLEDAPDADAATLLERDMDNMSRIIADLERELADALATIEEVQGEIYKWEQANGYD